MMKRVVRPRATTLAAADALSIAAVPVSAIVQVDAARNNITAAGEQLGVPIDTKLGKFDVAVNYNSTSVTTSTAKVDIGVTNVSVGNKEYNDKLKKKDWFDTAKYPKTTFASSTFKPGTGDKVDAVGKLTIEGITQDATAPVIPK